MTNHPKIFANFRENILMLAIFFAILPLYDTNGSLQVVHFLLLGSLLINNIRTLLISTILFRWEKIIFVAILCYEGILVAARAICALPVIFIWITLGLMLSLLFVLICIATFVYRVLLVKGKWSIPLSIDDAIFEALCNYFCVALSLIVVLNIVF